jgi:hypothetical protein
MNEPIAMGRDDEREIRELVGRFDAPAYVRRARQVEDAYRQLVEQCRRQRNELLGMVRIRLGQLVAMSGQGEGLRGWLGDDSAVDRLLRLHDELRPELRVVPPPGDSARALRRAALELEQSIARFNVRWQAFLNQVDLRPVNLLREGYNRHYLLEKECAIRSPRLAREGYRPLAPLTVADLATELPLLPVLNLVGGRQ